MDRAGLSGSPLVIGTTLDPARIVAQVCDPEIPFLSITDLGIVRSVTLIGDLVEVTITPTYSGCPAMDAIRSDIKAALEGEGFSAVVKSVLDPAWTTDDITSRGRKLLEENGIASPQHPMSVLCPRCAASSPRVVSEFGSTACKALMVCRSCGEPFDLFKELR